MDLASVYNSVAKALKPTESQPPAQPQGTVTPQVVQSDLVMNDSERETTAMEVDGPVAGSSRQHVQSSRITTSKVRAVTVRAPSLPAVLVPDPRRVGYIYDDLMLLHSSRTEHPEVPGRIRRVIEKLRDSGDLKKMKRLGIRVATKGEILLVHSEDHWDKVNMIQQMSEQDIIDTESYYDHLSLYVCPHTTYAALLSCGGVIEATLAVARGEIPKTFAIVRPPGHHAEPEEHMGFCFFNNVAVATRIVQYHTPIKRILILDWDVHHGNGTQRAFLEDPNVLYISLHRYEGGTFYPCGPFGGLDSCGEGAGLGKSVNIPWPEKGMSDADYLYAFHTIVMPIAMEFAPELVIISAGFDAAEGDELGQCKVTPGGYAHMTQMLSTLAGGKVVVALEGGYNIEAVGNSALAVARTLIGDDAPVLGHLTVSESAVETIWQVSRVQSRYWKNVNPKANEPGADVPELAIPIPEILKAFRQNWLYDECGMYAVPLLQDLQPRFEYQLACTKDVLEDDTIVIFVHQFGNIRVEISSALTFDVDLEYSYLIDVSRDLFRWVTKRKFALADVNTYPRFDMKTKITSNVTAKDYKPPKSSEALGLEALLYLWDNYIELSSASKLILIGHGPACQTIMDMITERKEVVMDRVKAVVQVVGTSTIPLIPKGQEKLRTWYKQHSFVAVPKIHPIFVDGTLVKRHGRVVAYDEEKPVLLLSTAMADIQQFIESSLL